MKNISDVKDSGALVLFSFWAGVVTHVGLTMMHQDWIGMEAYIEQVRNNWRELHPAIGFCVAGFGFSVFWLISKRACQKDRMTTHYTLHPDGKIVRDEDGKVVREKDDAQS